MLIITTCTLQGIFCAAEAVLVPFKGVVEVEARAYQRNHIHGSCSTPQPLSSPQGIYKTLAYTCIPLLYIITAAAMDIIITHMQVFTAWRSWTERL